MIKPSRLLVVFAPNSTRANEYLLDIQPTLQTFANSLGVSFEEVAIENLPFFSVSKLISEQVQTGDLVITAGGDGLTNAVLDGLAKSSQATTLAVLPLGQMNDFSKSLNGWRTNPETILGQQARDFYPLEIHLTTQNGKQEIFTSRYISFGVTAVLTDWLNSDQVRSRRRLNKNPVRSVILGARNIRPISHQISDLKSMNFQRNGIGWSLNSFGFFLGPAGNLFRLKSAKDLTFSDRQFFYHQTDFSGKMIRNAREFSAWLWRGLPGEISIEEEIFFDKPTDLRGQIGGDSIEFKHITKIAVKRSKRAIKVLAKNI